MNHKRANEKFFKIYQRNQKSFFPVLLNGKKVQKLFKGRGVPNTFIIDQEGQVRYRHRGFYDGMKKYIEMEISTLLNS